MLDGTGWTGTGSDDTQAAFRAHNQAIVDVTIKNLFIRNMPQQGIHAFDNPAGDFAHGWTVEHCDISYCKNKGIEFGKTFTIQHNIIHHNVSDTPYSATPSLRGGGYNTGAGDGTLFWNNEIAYNGLEQKIAGYPNASKDVIFRANYVHHNLGDGIWYDTVPDANALIEHNICEDNGRNSISIEGCPGSIGGIIRNNTVRRSGGTGIILTNSEHYQVSTNITIDCNRGLGVLQNFGAAEPTTQNTFTANSVTVPASPVPSLEGVSNTKAVDCSSVGGGNDSDLMNNVSENNFVDNVYVVPAGTTASDWFWWFKEPDPQPEDKNFAEWQAIGQDTGGSIGT